MTVAELIVKLQAFNPSLPIALDDDFNGGRTVPEDFQIFIEEDDGAVYIASNCSPYTNPDQKQAELG